MNDYSSPCSDCLEALETLELSNSATEADIKQAHRDLVKVWHPDRFEADSRLRSKAEAQLKKVNTAQDHLRMHWSPNVSPKENGPVTQDWTEVRTEPQPEYESVHPEIDVDTRTDQPTSLRYGKVLLRAVWRLFKLCLFAVLAVAVAAIVLLGMVAALSDYWSNEERIHNEPFFQSSGKRFFISITEWTGLPPTAARGFVFLFSALFILAAVLGQMIWGFAVDHSVISIVCVGITCLAVVAWAVLREQEHEFGFVPPGSKPPTSVSWVMGAVVLASVACATPLLLNEWPLQGNLGTPFLTNSTEVKTQAAAPLSVDSSDDAMEQPEPTDLREPMATKTMVVIGSVDLIQPADKQCQKVNCWWEIVGSHGQGAQDGWVVFAKPKPDLRTETTACVTAQFPLQKDPNPFLSNEAAAAHYPRLVSYHSADASASWGVYEVSETSDTCGTESNISVPTPMSEVNAPDVGNGTTQTVSDALSAWATAEESNDPARQAECYSDKIDRYFLSRNVSKDYVRDYMTTWLKEHSRRVVTFSPKDIAVEDESTEQVKVRLVKDVVTKDDQGSSERLTRSILYLRKENGQWKIFSEQDLK